MQRLLLNLRMILASGFTLPSDALAEMADSIVEQSNLLLSSIAAPTQISSISMVTIASVHEKIQDFTAAVEELQFAHSRRIRTPRRSPEHRFPSARRLPQCPAAQLLISMSHQPDAVFAGIIALSERREGITRILVTGRKTLRPFARGVCPAGRTWCRLF